MKHLGLKFNHGVEIGAHLAYVGHYKRTGDKYIRLIASEEVNHMGEIRNMLAELNEKPIFFIDESFRNIGGIIQWMCNFCPLWSLNLVAQTLEIFAVFNYRRLAKIYPQFNERLNKMADSEDEHKEFFRTGKLPKRLASSSFFDRIHIYTGPEWWVD